jgi:putative peptidoglycan lipid II flippase
MMWAPIANNVISVAVLVIYLLVFGPTSEALLNGPFTSQQELLIGLGSTLGIAAQFLILVPYLRRAGFTYRPRFDFRGTGLGHTLRLGIWTVLFVVVNQIAYLVVVRLASSGTAAAAGGCGAAPAGEGTGYTVYSSAFLIMMVPHSIITVSLATAILPRLSARAADGDLAGLARSLSSTLRTALVVVVPFALLLPLIASDLANVTWGYGAARDRFELYTLSLALFGPGLVFFTVHYLMLRGFYALERTRTVFYIQCAVAAANVLAAVLLVGRTDPVHTSPALVVAYAVSYAVGSVASYAVLRGQLGGLDTRRLVRFLVRMGIAVAVSTAVAYLVARGLGGLAERPNQLVAAGRALAVTLTDAVVFVAAARMLRLTEVTSVLDTVMRRRPATKDR